MLRRYRRWPSHRAWRTKQDDPAVENERRLARLRAVAAQHMPPLKPTAEDVARWEPYHCP